MGLTELRRALVAVNGRDQPLSASPVPLENEHCAPHIPAGRKPSNGTGFVTFSFDSFYI
jgi:hypothetical protein